LGAWDLVDDEMRPREITVTIEAVKSEALKTRESPAARRRCVLTFTRAHKRMIANTTNCEIIEAMYGSNVRGWVGKRVTLYQGDVKNPKGKGTVKGVRVRPTIPAGPGEELKSRDVDPAIRAAQGFRCS